MKKTIPYSFNLITLVEQWSTRCLPSDLHLSLSRVQLLPPAAAAGICFFSSSLSSLSSFLFTLSIRSLLSIPEEKGCECYSNT